MLFPAPFAPCWWELLPSRCHFCFHLSPKSEPRCASSNAGLRTKGSAVIPQAFRINFLLKHLALRNEQLAVGLSASPGCSQLLLFPARMADGNLINSFMVNSHSNCSVPLNNAVWYSAETKMGKNKMGVRNQKEMTSSTTEKDRDDHRQPLGLQMPQGSHIYFRSKI